MATQAINLPEKVAYGAVELKEYINKSTIRSFIITAALVLLFWITYIISSTQSENADSVMLAPIASVDLINLDAPVDEVDIPPPPPPQQIIPSGPAARAGTPTPIPDAEIAPDLQEFADLDLMDRASSLGGDGLDMGDFASNIDWDGEGLNINASESEPDPDEFVAVEKEPSFDLVALQKSVQYPKLAREAGVEGRVVVRALIDKSGQVKKTLIQASDNSLLNQAAIDAIKNYPDFQPAIQNKQPVTVWISIPIKFKLR